MSAELRFQDPGEGIHEAEVVEVVVGEGDHVEEGDTVLTVETDKATTEVPSPRAGRIAEVAVEPGQRVRVDDVLLRFADGDQPREEPDEPRTEDESEPAAGAEAKASPAPREREPEDGGDERSGRREGPVPASPATRRLARELGVGLEAVEPTGPAGRVLAEDVRRHAETPGEARESSGGEEPGEGRERSGGEALAGRPDEEALPDFSRWGEVEREPLRSVRLATARAMVRSWRSIPQVTHHDVVDVTALERFRLDHASGVEEEGGKLTLTVLVAKALVAALRRYPRFNASLDAEREEIVLKRYYNLGVAVATERGLLVPVARDIDRKSVVDLAVELRELAERARSGEIDRESLQGGTFTVTNVGPIGGVLFTPIIRHPEAAILGMGRATWQPVLEGDPRHPRVVGRFRLPLSLTFDHRLNDGAEAAGFVNHLAGSLGDPESLLLAV